MLRSSLRCHQIKRFMSEQVKFGSKGVSRVVTLSRPEKLNALSDQMCRKMIPTLQEYAKSETNNIVVIGSANAPRSLCSGGDVATVALQNIAGKRDLSLEFFRNEYSLNLLLATYNKPVVVLMDGITMGGGVGLATHVPFRIATENTRWCMPEMDIGFFPDVGTTFSLPQLTTVGGTKGQLALYLCLTGDLLSGIDVYMAGLASHYVPSHNLVDLQARLGELPVTNSEEMWQITGNAIEEFSVGIPEDYNFKYSNAQLDVIESCFDIGHGWKGINTALEKVVNSSSASPEEKEFARLTLQKLGTKSPVSVQVAIEQFRRNSQTDVESALKQDLVTASNMCEDPASEFSQATKHKLVDKSKSAFPWTKTSLTLEELSRLVSPRASASVSLQKFDKAVTWKKYPYHSQFMLPTEQNFKDYITGNDNSGRSLAANQAEVVKYFSQYNSSSKGKTGIEYLCNLVCSRKCTVGDAGELRWNN
ncbi:3-hydroxyisobutyryl-CoA hydrolase, mitochondrial [Lachancea thermotolerans]|uniref:3-hydroxyisobutyryl-CoA hydrolase n=1 Tax=Lachancea thermotolerans (strain ATCC 56472 / CBS 6340 / NRRL Y-8284) TaxID=559295 RepID=C5DE94_LACTC|nr:KLTH0C07304p [Lachancea thermotolerans CBS 6340]CAR22105.1 KLTH0C07304p [Lachancea thermotolerans CBS 6340]